MPFTDKVLDRHWPQLITITHPQGDWTNKILNESDIRDTRHYKRLSDVSPNKGTYQISARDRPTIENCYDILHDAFIGVWWLWCEMK